MSERKAPPGWMSKAQAMERLNCGSWALDSAIKKGEIQAKKFFGRVWIYQESVERLLKMDERAA
jgi:hypothetical protein